MKMTPETLPPLPGQRLQRGVCRALRQFDFVCVEELVPTPGLRVDVMGEGCRYDLRERKSYPPEAELGLGRLAAEGEIKDV